MGPRSTSRQGFTELYRYSSLGCLLAAAVILFMSGGWLLDRFLGTLPVFMVVGALVGAGLATVSMYRRLLDGMDENGEESTSSEDS